MNDFLPKDNGDHARMQEDIRELRKGQCVNVQAHGDILEKVDAVREAVGELRGDSKGGRWVVRVVYLVVALALPGLGWLMGSHEARIVDLQIWQASHVTADDGMREDVDHNTEQIERLRGLPRDSDVLRRERE